MSINTLHKGDDDYDDDDNNNNIYYNWVATRWQWLFYMYTKHEIGYY
jgi:hypothetical protein